MDRDIPGPLRAAGVTPREIEVFWLVADRLHNQEIADQLYLSVRTVESHVSSLLRKLGGDSRQSLVDVAARLGRRREPSRSLPSPLSTFVGRTQEVDDLLGLVTQHRLLTLTGPAGAGKTRLALHVARMVDTLPEPVLVDLASVRPGAAVERAFADALGVAADERRVRAALRQALTDHAHWLIVDNCEHVAPAAAALLAELLASTDRLTVLATSHGPVRVAGEAVYEVRPLPVPPDADDPAAVLDSPSGRLFADRAGAALPGFTVTAANARAVALICRQLDGLPLAIELAAARVRFLSPAELVSHLDDRFALLTDGAHGAPSRHRTLEQALWWSYQLLDDDERLVLERCSVFPGDFDYDTATDVLAYPPLTRADLTRVFPRLLDRSLISRQRRQETTEYRMLDSVRHFAERQLRARGGAEELRAQHARRHVHQALARLAALRGQDQVAALAWFNRRWADIRVAMRWALDHHETTLAWELLAGIGTGWEILGARGELFDWLDRLLDRPLPPGSLGVRSAVTAALVLCYRDTERARTLAEQAVATAQDSSEDDLDLARLALAWALTYRNEKPAALTLFTQAASGFAASADGWHYAYALSGLAQAQQDLDLALGYLARSAEIFRRTGDLVKRANCLNHMAIQAVENQVRPDKAVGWLDEAATLAERSANDHERLHAETFRATLEQSLGEHESARTRFASVLPDLRRIGDQRCVGRCLTGLGRAAASAGDHPTARRYLTEAVTTTASLGDAARMAEGLRLLAHSCYATGQFDLAAVLVGAADTAALQSRHNQRDLTTADVRLQHALRDQLGPAGLAAALDEGTRTPVAELVSRAQPCGTR